MKWRVEQMSSLSVYQLTCEYKEEQQGIAIPHPRFSWKLASAQRGTLQKAYHIIVSKAGNEFSSPVWDSGKIESEQSTLIEYRGLALESRTTYDYKVKVWDQLNNESDWSETASFSTVFLSLNEWKAKWISADPRHISEQYEGGVHLRKTFETSKKVISAKVYATAKGMYELTVNGEAVSDALLLPGWTTYQKRLQYQAFDVTKQLAAKGKQAIGITLANGWYRGMGFEHRNYQYGDYTAALLQLHLEYEDGTAEMIGSDQSWKSDFSAIKYTSIYHGETYDAMSEQEGWSTASFDDSAWYGVIERNDSYDILVAQENDYSRVTELIHPIDSLITPAGSYVMDMGQNMVGRVRFTFTVPAGTQISIKHAEVLDKDGNIYYGNLRPAKQTIHYTAKGIENEQYAPIFTFMGFRYIEIIGYPGGMPPASSIVGEVIHSDMEINGQFECSDNRINQLQQNIQWGQRGNFVDIPTDCPQRDERLGWTGDVQVFIPTALFNYNGASFFTKWLRDLKAEQHDNGGVPFVVPDVAGGANSAAWGDAAVICPWVYYEYYGDTRLLDEQYESMKAWVDYIDQQRQDEYLWNTGFHFGDWLALDAKEGSYMGSTPPYLIATAYFAYSTSILCKAAEVLGKKEDAAAYSQLLEQIKQSYAREFITPRGRVASPTQTAHVITLMFDLVEGEQRKRIANDLNQLIIENDYHLTTGFVGTPYLCTVLSEHGFHDTALRILLQESYPGWLYSVSMGATTVWEHWDSIKPDGSFWSDDMNSFNHYAYGAIGDWMYRKIAGLDIHSGSKLIHIEPMYGGKGLTSASASYQSIYGLNRVSWTREDKQISITIEVPANVTAKVFLRGAKLSELKENGMLAQMTEGVLIEEATEAGVRLTIGSGLYQFEYCNHSFITAAFSKDTRIGDLLIDEPSLAVMKQLLPQLFQGPMLTFMSHLTLYELTQNGMAAITQSMVDELIVALNGQQHDAIKA